MSQYVWDELNVTVGGNPSGSLASKPYYQLLRNRQLKKYNQLTVFNKTKRH